ncbi:MAG TPA: PhzF family phenazine biosynthesis isomerase [Nocardioides sp.]|nr:PhzF family phenazine biosynthesis isomerase [Nocardioides sp.]
MTHALGMHPMNAQVLKYAAFTDDGTGGNPAGVVLDSDRLTDQQMLAIAAAIGYSETAFVSADGRRLRFFSPRAEVAFCGHATVATAVALAERDGTGTRDLVTAAGRISVETRTTGRGLEATLTSPPASTREASAELVAETLAAFAWESALLDPAFPVHVANAGNDHLMLGLAGLETLAAFDYDYDALAALMEREGWTTVHAFVRERPTEFRARNAFPPGGVREDPATGAAAAAFGGYLRELGLVARPSRFTIHQGVEMGAPSRIEVGVPGSGEHIEVSGAATRLALSPYDELEWSR